MMFIAIQEYEAILIKNMAENERIETRIHKIEAVSSQNSYTFDGLTREDVEQMLRFKVEKGEYERKFTYMQEQLDFFKDILTN